MSEEELEVESLRDLEQIPVDDDEDLKRAIKYSLNDYDGEFSYMNGKKTLKIRDFINLDFLMIGIQSKIKWDYQKELTCSLKRKPTTS